MAGLIDAGTGFRYGTGLIFEAGLGGPGLDNPAPTSQVAFAGSGNLAVSATVRLVAQVTFAGSGGLRE